MKDHTLNRVRFRPLEWSALLLGEVVSQHQNAFFSDHFCDISNVARRVLAMLASGETDVRMKSRSQNSARASLPSMLGPKGLVQRLYLTSFDPDFAQYEAALKDLREEGCDDDTLAFGLIPAVARQLGASWENDSISFADVTIGCSRLQRTMYHMPESNLAAVPVHRQNCLVMVPSGAQHTLGALVLAKQLRHAQQGVRVTLDANPATLAEFARTNHFDLVLISASQSECPRTLRQLIAVSRSYWAACRIVVGGSITELGSDLATIVADADHLTNNWQEALDTCT